MGLEAGYCGRAHDKAGAEVLAEGPEYMERRSAVVCNTSTNGSSVSWLGFGSIRGLCWNENFFGRPQASLFGTVWEVDERTRVPGRPEWDDDLSAIKWVDKANEVEVK